MTVDDELIDCFLDGEADEDEAAELREWLAAPGNLEQFARRAELHSDLRRSLRRRKIQANAFEKCDEQVITARQRSPGVGNAPARSSNRVLTIGLAALATAACVWYAFVLPDDSQTPGPADRPTAQVVSQVDALLMKADEVWETDSLPVGAYRLQQGLIHLRFDGNVMVYVEAPAEFEATSGKHVVLHSGRLSAKVPPEGIGFTVVTPAAEVIDFGTEFSVDVEGGASEVHVFDGLVRVQPRSGQDGEVGEAVDLRTSQAVKIGNAARTPVDIQLAKDRFIRSFDEPKRNYPRSIKKLSPIAFYRMPIRDRGLAADPPQYSGVVLTGLGTRPPHARGVVNGGSLRVLADSSGRGGRVDNPPPLRSGQFTLVVFLYLEDREHEAIVATNIRGDEGNFALSLSEDGRLQATVRSHDGSLQSVLSETRFPLKTWRHVVITDDGEQIRLYDSGQLTASAPSSRMANGNSATLWFGTDADERSHWNGRIDELALFDKALSDEEIIRIHRVALDEMQESE